MRKLFLHCAITLDGMVSTVEQWVGFTEEAMQDAQAYHDTMDTIIFGYNNYAGLAAYWQQAETTAATAGERAFAKQVNDMPKLVVSHHDVELVWKNSQLLLAPDSAAFKQAIAQLKAMPGGDITVDSGEGTWRSFLEQDVWDGLDLLVFPLVIGQGKPLWASLPAQAALRLTASKRYANGMVNLRYERG